MSVDPLPQFVPHAVDNDGNERVKKVYNALDDSECLI